MNASRMRSGPRDATSARTAVLGEHTARLILGGLGISSVTYVDDDGEPLLVLPPTPEAVALVRGRRSVSLRIDGRDTVVLLHGRLTRTKREGSAAHALDAHRDCLADHGLQLDDALTIVRIAVGGVLTSTLSPRSPWWGVDLAAYVDAQPDTWTLYAEPLLAHLTAHHAGELLLLARRVQPAVGVDSRRWLLRAHGVDPDGLDLTIIGPSGGYPVRLSFERRLDSIDQVEQALLSA